MGAVFQEPEWCQGNEIRCPDNSVPLRTMVLASVGMVSVQLDHTGVGDKSRCLLVFILNVASLQD